jgi:hypothetical protein
VRSRWALNLVLFLTLLLLAWVIRHEIEVTRSPPTLVGSGLPEPHLIEIARDGEPTIELERLAAGWRMRAPWDVDADPERIAALLTIREAPLLRSVPAEIAALGELGLDPVRLRLRLDTTDFAVGGLDPIHQWRYLASEGLVHLVPDRFYHLLIAPPIDYVARALLPRDPIGVFATFDGVPLSRETLDRLSALVVERVEPLTGDLPGSPFELSAMDGTRVGYLVSEDGRRWSRPDLRLRYVLAEAPELIEDPGAIDPTPPMPVTDLSRADPARSPVSPEWSEQDQAEPEWDTDSFSTLDPLGPRDAIIDPDAPLSGDLPLGPPPEVRLRPHESTPETPPEPGAFGGELHRDPPAGFGLDPFAPDPDQP